MDRLVLGIALALFGPPVWAADFTQYDTPSLIQLFETKHAECQADLSGEVIQVCLDRTDISAILNRRGFCQSSTPSTFGAWQPCIVR